MSIIKVEITHEIDKSHPNGVKSSTKKIRLLGIVIYKKIHHYPECEEYTLCLN
jgi:hypothetical protein